MIPSELNTAVDLLVSRIASAEATRKWKLEALVECIMMDNPRYDSHAWIAAIAAEALIRLSEIRAKQ